MSVRKGLQRLELAGIPIEAISVGGLETCIVLPGFKLAFDIGLCPPEVVNRATVLFTHAHVDHMGGIAYHTATRSLRRLPAPRYVVPAAIAADLPPLFEAWRKLDGSDLLHELIPLKPGEEWQLRPDLCVRPFRAPHTVQAQGYALVSFKQKLLPELAELEGPEIARLRREGRRITERVETVEVAYPGDTRIEVVERVEAVRKARLLILEATFLDDRISVKECRSRGHVHLDEILERAELFENEAILLTHFSPRYRAREVQDILARRLPRGLKRRVTPLLAGLG